MEKSKRNNRNATATGLLTSILMALTLIDFNLFDFNNPTDLWRLVLIIIPTIGGIVSTFATKEQRGKKSSLIATILGLLTSVVTAWETIDFTTIDWHDKNNWAKLVVLSLPAISGYFSKIKGNKIAS